MFEKFNYQREYRKKQRADKKRLKEYHRAIRQESRIERKSLTADQITSFLKHPFSAHPLNPDQKLRKGIRNQVKIEKRTQRKKWIEDFRQKPVNTIFGKQANDEQLQLEQWRKRDKKIAFRNRLINSKLAFLEVLKSPEMGKRFALTILQSATYYMLAFLTVYIVYQVVTIAVAYAFNIPTIWYYYRVKFPLFTGSHLYTRIALISIFASGPLTSLAMAFLFLKLYFNRQNRRQGLKLFFLWGFICGANFFFGSYIVGFITRTEFIYTTEWIFLSSMFDVEEIIFAIISITISLLIGRLVTPLFLLTSGSEKLISSRFRLFFIIGQVILPWITGIIIFQIITTPEHYLPFTLKTITPVLLLIPSIFTYNSVRNQNIHISGVTRKSYFRWSLVIAVIAALFFYRVLLAFGLKLL